jgi:hypothetical protein
MASFLHASNRGARHNPDTLVLNHDCRPTVAAQAHNMLGYRMVYKAADHLLDLVHHHSGDKLCAYRRKPNTTDSDLLELWQAHFMVWI